MKRNKYMIATLVILIGMGAITVSCKKEKGSRRADIIVQDSRLGEDDEDPVIQGKVKKKRGFAAVEGALVETVSGATQNTVRTSYTDSEGEFEHQVPADNYYFRITVPGEAVPYVTTKICVTKSKEVLILTE